MKNEPEGSHQYTAIDYALAEDEGGFVQAAVLFRDAGKLSEGNICVDDARTPARSSPTAGRTTSSGTRTGAAFEIRGGDTVSYYVENYDTGELIHFAFKCSTLEDGTPHYETVDAPQ